MFPFSSAKNFLSRTFEAREGKTILLWGAALLLVLPRALMLVAYPFAFGHPDSIKYLGPAVALLEGRGLVPHPVSVSGTYLAFLTPILAATGSSFWVICAQHAVGIAGAVAAGVLLYRMTATLLPAWVAMIAVGLLPSTLIYEHMLLPDTLYACLWIFWLLAASYFLKSRSLAVAAALGFISAACLMARGQGLLAPLLSVGLLALVAWRRELTPRRLALALSLLLIPSALAAGVYRRSNIRHNQLSALSISGSFNLFWVATGNLLAFDSARFTEIKKMVEPAARDANGRFHGNASWGLSGESWEKAIRDVETHFNGNWGELDRTLTSAGVEAILSHPIAFTYRVLWNSMDALSGRPGPCRMKDLSELLLRCEEKKGGIDYAKAVASQRWNFLEFHDSDGPLRAHGRHPWAESLLGASLGVLFTFSNQRLLTLGVLFFLYCLLVRWPVGTDEEYLLLIFFVGHFLLTFPLVNALWDRYYLALTPIEVLVTITAIRRLSLNSRQARYRTLLGFAAVLSASLAGLGLASLVSPLTLTWDTPILGMAPGPVAAMHTYVFRFVGALVGAVVGVMVLRRVRWGALVFPAASSARS